MPVRLAPPSSCTHLRKPLQKQPSASPRTRRVSLLLVQPLDVYKGGLEVDRVVRHRPRRLILAGPVIDDHGPFTREAAARVGERPAGVRFEVPRLAPGFAIVFRDSGAQRRPLAKVRYPFRIVLARVPD